MQRRRARPAGRLPRLRGAHQEPDHAAAHPGAAHADGLEPRARPARHRAFSPFFLGALYLERVLGYDAIETGLAFLPMTIALATMSAGLSAARCSGALRALRTLVGGLASDRRSACCFSRAGRPRHLLPAACSACLLLGLGAGAVDPAAADDRDGRRPAPTRGSPRGSSTSRCSSRRDRTGRARHDRHRPDQVPRVGGESVRGRSPAATTSPYCRRRRRGGRDPDRGLRPALPHRAGGRGRDRGGGSGPASRPNRPTPGRLRQPSGTVAHNHPGSRRDPRK